MSCCEDHGAKGEADGECPVCGSETVDGVSQEICGYSSIMCEECGCAPCDGSC